MNRTTITKSLADALFIESVKRCCALFRDYNNNRPLLDLVESDDPRIWQVIEFRETVAAMARGDAKKKARPLNEAFEVRDFEIFDRVYTLKSQGVNIKSVNGALDIVAAEFHLSRDHVDDIRNEQRKKLIASIKGG